ncbi:hypothetical protein ACA910_005065 [Epithemia clementina (nom. ined.)]
MLLRTFIARRLASYYAQSADDVVSSSPSSSPIEFRRLLDEWQWKRLLDRMYREQKGQWFTPVELFKPYYSNAVANFIATNCRKGKTKQPTSAKATEETAGVDDFDDDDEEDYGDGDCPIEIVELGGGRGTNALCVLDHLRQHEPALYERVQYYLLDSSPTLHKLQQERINASDHAAKVSFLLKDLTKVAEGQSELLPLSDDDPFGDIVNPLTFVIALEVFDNLPHDKVKAIGGGGGPTDQSQEQRQQCTVRRRTDPPTATTTVPNKSTPPNNTTAVVWDEHFESLSDPLLSRMLKLAPSNYIQRNSATWVPTVALSLLHQLPKLRPRVQLLIADFDWFPDPHHFSLGRESQLRQPPQRRSLLAHEEPLIKSMDDGEDDGLMYECYLTAPALSDILFPTNFPLLSQFIKKSWRKLKRDVIVQKQADFLLRYGSDEVKKTKSWLTGYSPLIDDYSNTSVLTATFPSHDTDVNPSTRIESHWAKVLKRFSFSK